MEKKEMKADFGFMPPHRTKSECKKPEFADKHMHRIAIIKKEHFGSKGDRDENGLSGWVSKFVCVGCGKTFRIKGTSGYFHVDEKLSSL